MSVVVRVNTGSVQPGLRQSEDVKPVLFEILYYCNFLDVAFQGTSVERSCSEGRVILTALRKHSNCCLRLIQATHLVATHLSGNIVKEQKSLARARAAGSSTRQTNQTIRLIIVVSYPLTGTVKPVTTDHPLVPAKAVFSSRWSLVRGLHRVTIICESHYMICMSKCS